MAVSDRDSAPLPAVPVADCEKYAECMEEIKKRHASVVAVFQRRLSTGFPQTDLEYVWLQLRKILELIGLASLCAHRVGYERVRAAFHKDQNVSDVVKQIKRINPHYFPTPHEQIRDASGTRTVEVVTSTKDSLTELEYSEKLGRCSNFLHAKNPYSRKEVDVVEAIEEAAVLSHRVINLLNAHGIRLVGTDAQLWVVMHAETDGRAHVHQMHPKEPDSGQPNSHAHATRRYKKR